MVVELHVCTCGKLPTVASFTLPSVFVHVATLPVGTKIVLGSGQTVGASTCT